MAKAELLAALEAFRTHIDNQLEATNSALKSFMSSVDLRFAQLQSLSSSSDPYHFSSPPSSIYYPQLQAPQPKTSTQTTFDDLLKKLENAMSVSAVPKSEIGLTTPTEQASSPKLLSENQCFPISEGFNKDVCHPLSCTSPLPPQPTPPISEEKVESLTSNEPIPGIQTFDFSNGLLAEECHSLSPTAPPQSPPRNTIVCGGNSEGYCATPASRSPAPAPPWCWQIGRTEKVLWVFNGRATLTWVEEPPGIVFLEHITYLRANFSFQDWNKLLFRKEPCHSLSSFLIVGDKHLYHIAPLVRVHGLESYSCTEFGFFLAPIFDIGDSHLKMPFERLSEIAGSSHYMAFEILKRNYGPEVDIWSAGVILYILLCGVPFWAEIEHGAALATLRGVINIKKEPWPSLSRSAKNLVSVRNIFKKKVLWVIAEHLAVEEEEVIRDMSALMDMDNNEKNFCSKDASQRYHTHIVNNGTLCDLMKEPREAGIRFACSYLYEGLRYPWKVISKKSPLLNFWGLTSAIVGAILFISSVVIVLKIWTNRSMSKDSEDLGDSSKMNNLEDQNCYFLSSSRSKEPFRINIAAFEQPQREFLAEMDRNLVSLLGYCSYSEEMFLIYKYKARGSLDHWVRNRTGTLPLLDWSKRFKIALGSARGMVLLHRDTKASGNILLDEELKSKVDDFGLARLISACETHVSTAIAGMLEYIPPEYGQSWKSTTRGDMYNFGVILLELLIGKEPAGLITKVKLFEMPHKAFQESLTGDIVGFTIKKLL